MDEKLTQKDFKAFEKVYASMLKEIKLLRTDAVGILDPEMLTTDAIKRLQDLGQSLVLARGRRGKTDSFSGEQLEAFNKAIEKAATLYKPGEAGVPLHALIRRSRKADILASKEVRSATLYKVVDGLLSFRVTATGTTPGVSYHQVQVRLEDWSRGMHSKAGFIMGAQAAATGRVSFDCTCGRHQYWYRYIATMGGFALKLKEQGFPKIRNETLTGCCCKHVLKVLYSLKSGGLHLQLAKEMELQAKAKGFSSAKSHYLTGKELERVTTASVKLGDIRSASLARREVLAGMHKALKQHKDAADALSKTQKPRSKKPVAPPSTLQKDLETYKKFQAENIQAAKTVRKGTETTVISATQRKELTRSIKGLIKAAKTYGITHDGMLNDLAKKTQVSRATLDTIAKEEGLL